MKTKVVMLASNEKAHLGDIILTPDTNKLLIFEHTNSTECKQHLYVISNDEIKEGDYFYDKVLNIVCITDKYTNIKYANQTSMAIKVIASTDTSLQLPLIHQSSIDLYITEYNKGNIINDVEVEYEVDDELWNEEVGTKYGIPMKLHINKDNTINISLCKTYTKDEVIKLIYAFIKDKMGYIVQSDDIKEFVNNN